MLFSSHVGAAGEQDLRDFLFLTVAPVIKKVKAIINESKMLV